MAVKKGDLIDERKRHSDGCGLVVKIIGGGAGFEKIICCGHELTEEDLVTEIGSHAGRKKGELPSAVVFEEKLVYPDACGLRVMVMAGGAGFQEIRCCGHSLTTGSLRELRYHQMGGLGSGQTGQAGTA
ncbi:MAG: hypothetical protein ACT4OO_09500 [Nitrospiraceae bacterium]